MKKTLILGFLCLMATNSFAQKLKLDLNETTEVDERVSPLVREKIDTYALEVRQIVIDQKIAMEAEIAKVNLDEQNGILTQSEANNLKADIALRFSEVINSNIQNLKFDLDELTKKQVQYTVLNTDLEELKKEKEIKLKKEKYKPLNEMVGYFSAGVVTLSDGDNANLNNHLGNSTGIDLGILYNRQLSQTSPFVFLTGAYLSWRTLKFDDNYRVSRDENGVVDLVQHTENLSKSKLRATYLMVPLGMKYSFSSLKTSKTNEEIKYRNTTRGIAVSANLYGGYLLSNNNIVKGGDINERDHKSNYRLNNIAYGAQFTFIFNGLSVFVRQELSPYFEKNTFDDRKMLQFGLSFGF